MYIKTNTIELVILLLKNDNFISRFYNSIIGSSCYHFCLVFPLLSLELFVFSSLFWFELAHRGHNIQHQLHKLLSKIERGKEERIIFSNSWERSRLRLLQSSNNIDSLQAKNEMNDSCPVTNFHKERFILLFLRQTYGFFYQTFIRHRQKKKKEKKKGEIYEDRQIDRQIDR